MEFDVISAYVYDDCSGVGTVRYEFGEFGVDVQDFCTGERECFGFWDGNIADHRGPNNQHSGGWGLVGWIWMSSGVSCVRSGALTVGIMVGWWAGTRARDVEKGVPGRGLEKWSIWQ